MKRLKNLILGVLLLIATYLLDKQWEEKMPDYNKDFKKAGEIVCVIALALLFLWLLAWTAGAQPLRNQMVVASEAENALDFLYFTVAERANFEGLFCLHGKIDPKSMNSVVQSISLVWTDSADGMNVVAKLRCGADGIGMIHFHTPNALCSFSDGDILNAHQTRTPIEAIYCKLSGDSLPSIQYLHLYQVDSIIQNWPTTGTGTGDGTIGRTWTAVFRRRRPP